MTRKDYLSDSLFIDFNTRSIVGITTKKNLKNQIDSLKGDLNSK